MLAVAARARGERSAARRRASAAPKLTNITLQLKWVPQAQFAGYYAASLKGFYKAQGLNVTLKNGGPNIIPEQVVASGQAQFGVDWLPSLLAARDKGTDLVNVAQVFARSGMTQLTWKSSGINTIAKMKGKKVAQLARREPVRAVRRARRRTAWTRRTNKGVTIVQQPFDMNLFLKHQVDSASAMTYNELAQVLESKNPKTGKLYTLVRPERDQDAERRHRHARGRAVLDRHVAEEPGQPGDRREVHRGVARRAGSTAATTQADCVNMTLKEGPTLPKGHQTWQMNEINKLIWPNTAGIGIMNTADYNRTAQISKQFGVIKKAPSGAYRTDLAKKAVAQLKAQGVDVNGASWKPVVVKLTAGGK